ncbi:ATP-binding cassette domain-containing protein [Microbacterium sp. Root180]|uniref:ATP-binding cassette domain-containing protein n=1 Tax=Microbacterium sp. Root180 TaxID=1736483 RepID=UPI0019109415|nr:ATP-binding cassette domain-containing protein [Microbacterium sp. Root180]
MDGVTFSLPEGGSLAIVGESGSGKTTTARIIAGLERPTSGGILFRGQEWNTPAGVAERRARARQVQMVFQDPFGSLDPRQSLGASLDEILVIHNHGRRSRWRAARSEELMEMVGLDGSHLAKLPRALSGGQRQRFAIGRALAVEPELLILDEAVSALDVSVQAQVLNLLIDLRARIGVSYLFVSHDLAVVRQISDSVIVMKDGRVVESGDTDEVMDRPRSEYARKLLAAIPRPAWELP